MHIRLVPHVKDQTIFLQVKDPVDCHRQLHHAQIGRQMAAGFGDVFHQEGADLAAEGSELVPIHGAQGLRGRKFICSIHF